jgi:hypothetical protein
MRLCEVTPANLTTSAWVGAPLLRRCGSQPARPSSKCTQVQDIENVA